MSNIEFRSSKNTVEFNVEAGSPLFASSVQDKFVLLRTPSLEELRDLLASFRESFIGGIRNYLRSVPADIKVGVKRLRFEHSHVIGLGGAPYTVRPERLHYRFTYFQKSVVTNGMKALGLDRKYVLHHNESLSTCAPRMDIEDQVRLVDWLTNRPLEEWGRIAPQPEFRLWLAPDLEDSLASAEDPLSFLENLAEQCIEFLIRGTRKAQNHNRPIGHYWFAKHLHQAGVWLFPLGIWSLFVQQGIPGSLKNLARTCLFHPGAVPFYDGWLVWLKAHSTATDERTLGEYIRTFSFVDHTSTFCPNLPLCPELIAYYQSIDKIKADGTIKEKGDFVGLRFLFRYLHEFYKVELGNHVLSLKLAGKTKRQNRDAWSWVDDPEVSTSSGHYEHVVGRPEPAEHPAVLLAWVTRLRELLPLLAVKDYRGPITSLSEWLLYLCKLDARGDPVPWSLQSIVRSQHINSAGIVNYYTFIDFLGERDIAVDQRNRALTNLRQMWILDTTQEGLDIERCPILQRIDRFKKPRGSWRHWRTVRDAMEPEIWQIIVEENRRNDFEFSRTRMSLTGKMLDYRPVTNPATGQAERIWFPGTAVLIDLLLNIPFRQAHARFLDSGEGDEKTLDLATLEYEPNRLPTATIGRQQGFFRRSKLGLRKDQVALGMYINTNKTGPDFEVPWLPIDVARNVAHVIAWQKTYNPMFKPTPAANLNAGDLRYGDLDLYGDTYPIFRDPADPTGRPVSPNNVSGYYRDLLEHVEPILSERLGFEVSLFEDDEENEDGERGAPVFDLHSLRVTGVTTLLAHGVPVDIVRRLVGHASDAMTWYYNAVSNARIHAELQKAMEQRKLKGIDLRNMTEADLERLKANVFNTRNEEDFAAFSMLKHEVLARTPQWEMLPHGICPGGRCEEGGAKTKNGYEGLHRDRACSLCRFRITGPMFLHGLVQHQNILMWEIKQSLRKIAEFTERADRAEDEGRDPAPYRAQAKRDREFCDQLYEEWFAEYVYVRRAEGMLEDWLVGGRNQDQADRRVLPALLGQADPSAIKVDLTEVHELRMLHDLVRDADIIAGAQLPRGIAEDRNEMLLRIARANKIDHFFYRLDQDKAKAALTLFADAVLDTIGGAPDAVEKIEGLVTGQISLHDLPALEAKVTETLKSIGQSSTRMVLRGSELMLTEDLES